MISLVQGIESHSLRGNVTEHLIKTTTVPLLTVKKKGAGMVPARGAIELVKNIFVQPCWQFLFFQDIGCEIAFYDKLFKKLVMFPLPPMPLPPPFLRPAGILPPPIPGPGLPASRRCISAAGVVFSDPAVNC